VGLVSVEALGGGVPGEHHPVERLPDYGVVRRGDQGRQELLGGKPMSCLDN